MTTDSTPTLPKSEILFLYESKYSLPNGDPFTNEQRYDEETKQILVSDVRIKRFIRDYLYEAGHKIFVIPAKPVEGEARQSDSDTVTDVAESGAAQRFEELKRDSPSGISNEEVLLQCIDARLFGAVVTIKGTAQRRRGRNAPAADDGGASRPITKTGPVQFALLNPSLNRIDLRPHQNTSRFVSRVGKGQGAIATTSLVPYALNQIHGWIDPYSARETNLTQKDIDLMFRALWESVNSANTRSKSNQDSLLLLQIVYKEPHKKIYGVDSLITLKPNDKQEEQIRRFSDYTLDFSALLKAVESDRVAQVNFYTEDEGLTETFKDQKKFNPILFYPDDNSKQEDDKA